MVIFIQCIALLAGNTLIIILDHSPHFQRIKTQEECHNCHNDNGAGENERNNASNFSETEAVATCADMKLYNGYVHDDDCTNNH